MRVNECHVHSYVCACLTECGDDGSAQRRKSDCCVIIPWSECKTSTQQHVVAVCSRLRSTREPTVREEQHPSKQELVIPKQLSCLTPSITSSRAKLCPAVGTDEVQSGCRISLLYVLCSTSAADRLHRLPEARVRRELRSRTDRKPWCKC